MARLVPVQLPPASVLKTLPTEAIQALVDDAGQTNRLIVMAEHREYVVALAIASGSLLMSIVVFAYLVMNGHDKAAAAVIGVSVLSVITRMLKKQ